MKAKSEEARFYQVFDKIWKHFQNEDRYPLTPELESEYKRWKAAYNFKLLQRPLTDTFIVEHLIGFFKISEPQAWRDVRNMKRFFASMEKTNEDYNRIVLEAQIRDLRVKSEEAGSFNVAAMCDANLIKLGVGKEAEEETSAPKTINLLVGFNPKLIGAKENPNLLKEVAKHIGEAQARRELMIADDETIDDEQ